MTLGEFTISYVGDLQRINPQPGDVFVLSCPAHLNRSQVDSIRAGWRRDMGDARMIVLAGGLKLTLFNVQAAMQEGVKP